MMSALRFKSVAFQTYTVFVFRIRSLVVKRNSGLGYSPRICCHGLYVGGNSKNDKGKEEYHMELTICTCTHPRVDHDLDHDIACETQ